MRLLALIAVLFVQLMTAQALFLSEARDLERKYRCEQLCNDRYWSCRQRASAKKGREKEKASGICHTFFVDCMNSCKKM